MGTYWFCLTFGHKPCLAFYTSIFSTCLASQLPTCQSAEMEAAGMGSQLPAPPAPFCPGCPLWGWRTMKQTLGMAVLSRGDKKSGCGKPSNTSAKQSLRLWRTWCLHGLRPSHIMEEGGGRGWRVTGAKRLWRTPAEHFWTVAHPCPKDQLHLSFLNAC